MEDWIGAVTVNYGQQITIGKDGAWIYIGGENLGAYWEWQWRPYVEFWEDEGMSGFFRHAGAPYLTILYVVIAIFALLLLRRILTFAAKAVLAFTIAQTALYPMGAEGIWQPDRLLYVASAVSVVWLIASGQGSLIKSGLAVACAASFIGSSRKGGLT